MLHYPELAADYLTECAAPRPPDPWGSVERSLRMLWRRRWLFVLIFVPVLAIGSCLLIVMPKRFTAHATLIVGFRQPE